MSKQLFVSLLIISGVLSQGTVVSSFENIGSSSFRIRPRPIAQLQHPEVIRSPQQHQSAARPIPRTRFHQLVTPTSVSIRINGIRVGLGTVVDSFIVATRARYFRNTTLAQASVTFYSPTRRDYERRGVRHIELCRGIPSEPLEPHDVALVVVNQRILVHPDTDIMLQENFTPGEIMWIRGTVLTMVPRLRRRNH